MKTIDQILTEVRQVRPISSQHLYRRLRELDIKPLGEFRQRPQRYPADTAARLLAAMGYQPETLPTMAQLKAIKEGARV